MGNARAKGRVGGEERLTASEWLARRAADFTWLETAAAGDRGTPGDYLLAMGARLTAAAGQWRLVAAEFAEVVAGLLVEVGAATVLSRSQQRERSRRARP